MILRIPKSAFFLLVLAAILLVTLFIIIFISIFSKNPTSPQPNPQITRVDVPLRRGDSQVQPKNISPKEDTSGQTIKNPSQKITISVSKNISPQNIRVTISPDLPIKITTGQNPNEILIFPDPPEYWRPNVLYSINIYDNQNKLITSYNIKVPEFKVTGEPL